MTRKDYVMLALTINHRMTEHKEALAEIGITVEYEPAYNEELAVGQTIELLAVEIADALAADNKAFDKNRFLTACGVL